MDPNIKPIDTRSEAIQVMAWALEDLGYTRDSDPREVTPRDVMEATRPMIRRYLHHGDLSACFEFITEGSRTTDEDLINKLTDAMLGNRIELEALGVCLCTRARVYGESFLQEALDLLPSASEIQRDREADHAIDERKSA